MERCSGCYDGTITHITNYTEAALSNKMRVEPMEARMIRNIIDIYEESRISSSET